MTPGYRLAEWLVTKTPRWVVWTARVGVLAMLVAVIARDAWKHGSGVAQTVIETLGALLLLGGMLAVMIVAMIPNEPKPKREEDPPGRYR